MIAQPVAVLTNDCSQTEHAESNRDEGHHALHHEALEPITADIAGILIAGAATKALNAAACTSASARDCTASRWISVAAYNVFCLVAQHNPGVFRQATDRLEVAHLPAVASLYIRKHNSCWIASGRWV